MSRPLYSVVRERNMIIRWETTEEVGEYRSLLTARHAASHAIEQGVPDGTRVAIRDKAAEARGGFMKGWIGRVYKPLTRNT
jgi:hypothetical protein